MSNKNLDYYQKRLQEISEILNILYIRGSKSNKKTILFIRKFDSELVNINTDILKKSLTSDNSMRFNLGNPSYNSEYVPLCQKYIKIMKNIHNTQNEILVVQELRLESKKIEKEILEFNKLMVSLPNVPNDVNNRSKLNNMNIKII